MSRFLVLLLLFSTLLPAAAPAAEPAAVIFMYHRFGEAQYPSTSVRLEQFDAQLDYLAENGFHVWPLAQVVEHLVANRPLPDRTVAITIDDAYLSVYERAWPRLRKRNWPFTVFVATDAVDAGQRDTMSWAQMRELAAAGVTFANHTASHDSLVQRRPKESSADWKARIRADVEQGQRRLQEELGRDVNRAPALFAYPYGEYNSEAASLVQALGYVALGQHSGAVGASSDRRALPRYPVNEAYGDLPDFRLKAVSLPFPIMSATPWEPVLDGNNPPALTLTLATGAYQASQLACYASGQGRIPVTEAGERTFVVQAPRPFPKGRARYNCTAPHEQGGRFYWYSHPWIVP